MNSNTLKCIHRILFRFLGLECYSNSSCSERCLIVYMWFIVASEVGILYYAHMWTSTHDFQMVGIMNCLWAFLYCFYKMAHTLITLRAIWWRRQELDIAQGLQQIQQDILSTRLSERFKLEKVHAHSRNKQFYQYYWLFDICWMFAVAGVDYYQHGAEILCYSCTNAYTVLAMSSIYMQFLLIIVDIEEKLLLLEKSIQFNLLRRGDQGPDVITKVQLNLKLPVNCELFKPPPKDEILCLDFTDYELHDAGVDSGNVNNELSSLNPILIWTMQHSYGRIVSLSRMSSLLYGLSVFITNFLCICDFSRTCYIIVTSLAHGYYDGLLIYQTLFAVVPAVVKFISLCWLSERCSRRTSSILLKLRSSPMKSLSLDDFILQITQNPIKFSAYNFYELNTQTLTKVFIIVFDLMVFLLQIFSLTRKG